MQLPGVRLGVDFGTSNTVAVLQGRDGHRSVLLFDSSPVLPSAVYWDPAGPLTGLDAVHSARVQPELFEPSPKLRIDDQIVLLGPDQVPVPLVIGAVLRRVYEEATRVSGGPPGSVTLTHPAAWGPRRREVLVHAAAAAGMPAPLLVPEPVAAATWFVLGRAAAPVVVGASTMVYDFGAGTFDASVLRRTTSGFEVLASDGLPDAGGLDIDTAIVAYLGATFGATDRDRWQRLTRPATAEDRRAHRQLWDDVRRAKELLSRHAATYVHLPLFDTDVPLGREQLDLLANAVVTRTVNTASAIIRTVGLTPDQLAGVYLVGGSSRLPLAAAMLHRVLGVAPVALEQPELAVAQGSLLATEYATSQLPPAAPAPWPPVSAPPVSAPPVSGPPVSGPPVSGPPAPWPPVSAPPMSAPPMSAPPVSGPPVSAPPVSAPPMSGPPVSAPPVSAPPVSGPPAPWPPVSAPPVSAPPVSPAPAPPVGGPTVARGTASVAGAAHPTPPFAAAGSTVAGDVPAEPVPADPRAAGPTNIAYKPSDPGTDLPATSGRRGSRWVPVAAAAAVLVLVAATALGVLQPWREEPGANGVGQGSSGTAATSTCTLSQFGGTKIDLKTAKVGYSQPDTKQDNRFRIAMTRSITDEAQRLGITNLVVTNADSRSDKQVTDVSEMIDQGAQLLVIAPLSSDGWDPVLTKAQARKIPIIAIDRKINATHCAGYLTSIGSDFYEQGKRAADRMAKALDNTGSVAILLGSAGNNVTTDRTAGFKDHLAKIAPNIKVEFEQTGEFSREQGQSVTQQMLLSKPTINGIYAENDEMALGAVNALKAAGKKAGDFKIVTIDGTQEAVQGIIDGWISSVIESNPRFGPLAFSTATDFFNGQGIADKIILQDREYTTGNAKDDIHFTY